jgi:hypothetical protein
MIEGASGIRRIQRAAMLGAAVLFTALGVSACGGGSSDSESASTAESFVSAENLNRYEPGTPQRTVMQWWKAVQFGNATVVHHYYAPGKGPRLSALQRELAVASNQFAAIPTIDSAELRGNKDTLYLFATRPGSSAPPRAMSVNLVRIDGRWGLADDQLLAQVVERVESASQRASN